jgi:hypothetical protein
MLWDQTARLAGWKALGADGPGVAGSHLAALRIAHRHLWGISLGGRALLPSTLRKGAYFASRIFLIICSPRPPCFKQVGTPFKAMFRQRSPVHRAIASQSRLLARPRLNADCTLDAFQAALPLPAVLPPISGPLSKLSKTHSTVYEKRYAKSRQSRRGIALPQHD